MRLHSIKWLLVAGLVAGSVKAYQSRQEWGEWIRRHQFQLDGLGQALPSQVYFLETNRWLTFDVPGDAGMVRLISNASVSSTNQAPSGTQWPYAIEYQVCNRQGGLLASGVYHFKGRQLVFVDRRTRQPAEVNSYLDRSVTPLNGRRWMFNFRADAAVTNANVLRLRLHSSHPDLLEIAARVYFQSRIPERKLAYRWNRLSEDQKRDLARGNVYSFEGLTSEEKHGLLRDHWLVAAPEGIPGRDFRCRVLYIRDDSETLKVLKDWVPAGIAVDQDHRGVLPVTNSTGACEFQMHDYAPSATSHPVSSSFVWHGEPGQPPETSQMQWSGRSPRVIPPARDGLVEISASGPAYVRAYRTDVGGVEEITPEPVHLVTYIVSSTNPLDYVVNHAGNEPALFRVDIRRPVLAGTKSLPPDGYVRYELIAEEGDVLKAGNITLTNAFSAYDWLVASNGLANISEPQSLCFRLAPGMRKLRLSTADGTLYANAYSRPLQLTKQIRVPADYSPTGRVAPDQPSWFTLRPLDHLERRGLGQSVIVRLQPRPPEQDSLILTGQYEWDSFLPENASSGRMILLPATQGLPLRPESLSYAYTPVATGRDHTIRFEGLPWEREVAPSLILVSTNDRPGAVSIKLDGRLLITTQLETPVSAMRLGNVSVGEHALQITADQPITAYANFPGTNPNKAYLQRFCIEATSNSLHFRYTKRQSGVEALVLRIFSPAQPGAQPFKVRMRLKPSIPATTGPHAEITLLDREAWVTPGSSGQTWLVASFPARLDSGQPVFFPVGEDVPPGEHDVEVTISAPSARWLSLSRTTPGVAEKFEITSSRAIY